MNALLPTSTSSWMHLQEIVDHTHQPPLFPQSISIRVHPKSLIGMPYAHSLHGHPHPASRTLSMSPPGMELLHTPRITSKKHFKSRNPVFNIPRRSEAVATDTIFSVTPAVDDGSTMAQFFCGRDTLVCDAYGIDNPGDRLTWRILTEDTQKIIICSGIQSAIITTTNQCLASPSGEGTTLPSSIPYPQQSKNSLPLDPFEESTPNFEQFANCQSGEDEDNPIHMANIDIPNLLGRSFLLPPEDNGEHHMAKIIDIDDHGQPLEDIKFKLKINKDQAEEIMSYNQLMDYIQKGTDAEEDPDPLFKFRDIVAPQGPLESTDPDHKGSKYNVMVEWESGEVTYEPLTLISKDDPITCAVYAKIHDLLDTTGWRHLKRYAKTSKRLIRAVKQSRIRQVRASARYQHGFQHWQDAMDLELSQIHEYKVLKDTGKAQFYNGKAVTPDGFKKIRVHFVYAVKHDGRFKARLVADGHLTKEPVESIYSGVVSLRRLRMVVFLSQLNNLEIWGADVGNADLEAYTDEKLCIIAGPEFKELQGHLLIMVKALYGTRSGGARWHDRLFDILQELKFKPSKADPDVWMRPEPGGTCYEYIAVYVDDLAIAAKDPQAFCN